MLAGGVSLDAGCPRKVTKNREKIGPFEPTRSDFPVKTAKSSLSDGVRWIATHTPDNTLWARITMVLITIENFRFNYETFQRKIDSQTDYVRILRDLIYTKI